MNRLVRLGLVISLCVVGYAIMPGDAPWWREVATGAAFYYAGVIAESGARQ